MPARSHWLTTRHVALILLLSASNYRANPPTNAVMPLRESRQCLVVVTPSWLSSTGQLTAFERDQDSPNWLQRGQKILVVLGQNGLGWGRGLAPVQGLRGPVKREGDQRSPAGVFRLSSAFGYAAGAETSFVKLPYLALTSQPRPSMIPNRVTTTSLSNVLKFQRPIGGIQSKSAAATVFIVGESSLTITLLR
jgi:L,D-peptidoglycan transpeptidase YkuD (ErfK/YbiS/YcfS/YnhG family)